MSGSSVSICFDLLLAVRAAAVEVPLSDCLVRRSPVRVVCKGAWLPGGKLCTALARKAL